MKQTNQNSKIMSTAKFVVASASANLKSSGAKQLIVLAPKGTLRDAEALSALIHPALGGLKWTDVTRPLVDGDHSSASYWPNGGDFQFTVAQWKDDRGRNAGNIRADNVASAVKLNLCKSGDVQVIVHCPDATVFASVASSLAVLFPLYNQKTGKDVYKPRTVSLDFCTTISAKPDYAALQRLADGVRTCARWVDMPPSELYTDKYVEEVQARVKEHLTSVKSTVIRGEQLRDGGYGGLWGVGKASSYPPALVVLSHTPQGATHTTAWVGKGIVFDTGGLSIKGGLAMPTMKTDMGGSAAIYAAFEAAVLGGYKENLHALLCIAENSVSAASTRPDDILYMYSGKTVEVNNTDAEGRLVLGDGVAYASRHLSPDVILDMATLTGAQGICTGQKHAAILSNTASMEALGFQAGQVSGDLAYPILYAPELLMKEFDSEVADMKNSVKSRSNAQSSCAGHFIESHIDPSFKGDWIHVDMAGPSYKDGRATGYGVAFLLELLKQVQTSRG